MGEESIEFRLSSEALGRLGRVESERHAVVVVCGERQVFPPVLLDLVSERVRKVLKGGLYEVVVTEQERGLGVEEGGLREAGEILNTVLRGGPPVRLGDGERRALGVLGMKLESQVVMYELGEVGEFVVHPLMVRPGGGMFEFRTKGFERQVSVREAALLSGRAAELISNERKLELEFEIPEWAKGEDFVGVLEEVFELTDGVPLRIDRGNAGMVGSIGEMLGSGDLVSEARRVGMNVENVRVEDLLGWLSEVCGRVEEQRVEGMVEAASAVFGLLDRSVLRELSPMAMNAILESGKLEVVDEDSLMSLLIDYVTDWGIGAAMVLENIRFVHVSPGVMEEFFERIPVEFITQKTWNGVNGMAGFYRLVERERENERKRRGERSRWKAGDVQSFRVSEGEEKEQEIAELEKELMRLRERKRRVEYTPNVYGTKGLCAANRQRSEEERFIEIKASSTYEGREAKHLLEWGNESFWSADKNTNETIDITLRGSSLMLRAMSFLTRNQQFPKKFEILGSNGDEKWSVLCDVDNDQRLNTGDQVVLLDISSRIPYRRFRIQQKSSVFRGTRYFFKFSSLEMYGIQFVDLPARPSDLPSTPPYPATEQIQKPE